MSGHEGGLGPVFSLSLRERVELALDRTVGQDNRGARTEAAREDLRKWLIDALILDGARVIELCEWLEAVALAAERDQV